ncbi:hypothetical protein Kpol_1076p5 [Vanderwaltozyma polyspora DSM 70294]|uniref:Bax inhibitor 1 n=1 Tax=Vanderwaltozyma polyspora (strain ATCC 22028 / DSM 70294 / BCRC 21397 / CBS 2163 / NBRC 10782 / NRRL Y-8283 / UCD 57-17) TaxID=436907 RepID=A7TSF6_VANPO|nr:uncharacterized protein Kpol_1076p5 [Vanderwaltozyma polyspora DSM 70294]EDO14799.1 hypothetical protein Kpol_1076p5 [Vanderwaltozyma polyspora DSM 70294]
MQSNYDITTTQQLPDDFKYSVKVISCEPEIRSRFQRKVYSLLSIQLLCTFIFSLSVIQYKTLQVFITTHLGLWFLALFISMVSCIWLSVVPNINDMPLDNETLLDNDNNNDISARRKVPWYYLPSRGSQLLMLMIFTLAESYTLALVTLSYDSDTVLSALLITVVVVVGVTVSSLSPLFQTSMQTMSSIYYWLNWALWFLIGLSFATLFFGISENFSTMIFGWLGAFVFTIYLFVDTQLIFRKCYIDDEIKCCMMLYLDIINLFISILRIVGSNDDN